MSDKQILKSYIYPIKTELIKISKDIKYYINNSEHSEQELLEFHKKYNSLVFNLHRKMDELLPLC